MISTRFKLILIWIVAGSTAYMMASYPINSVLINNEFVPFAPDSFYHARRILFLLNNGVFLQFDPNVNAPYGEFVSWPWAYDTFVPIFFAGNGIPAQTITRRVSPADIAPTLASYLNIKFPSGTIGNPLKEVLVTGGSLLDANRSND